MFVGPQFTPYDFATCTVTFPSKPSPPHDSDLSPHSNWSGPTSTSFDPVHPFLTTTRFNPSPARKTSLKFAHNPVLFSLPFFELTLPMQVTLGEPGSEPCFPPGSDRLRNSSKLSGLKLRRRFPFENRMLEALEFEFRSDL